MECNHAVFWWEIQIPWLVELSEFKKRGNKMKKRTIIGPRNKSKVVFRFRTHKYLVCSLNHLGGQRTNA